MINNNSKQETDIQRVRREQNERALTERPLTLGVTWDEYQRENNARGSRLGFPIPKSAGGNDGR